MHAKTARPKLKREQAAELTSDQVKARELEEKTTVKAGMNHFQWDLRTTAAYDVPGYRSDETDDFPDTGDGPTIVPGAYSVLLQYGGQRLSAPLTLKLDPRIHPAAGDLEARYALEMQLRNAIDRIDRAIAAAMAGRGKLPAATRSRVDAEIADLILLGVDSSEADVLRETKVRQQLAFLMNSLENAYARPTPAEYAAANDLEALATDGAARLRALTPQQ
jgi:hypothetical protein